MALAKWYRLENFRCPISGCDGANEASNWYCYNDSTDIYISQTGHMRCSRCSNNFSWDHYGLICNWRFDCGRHGNHPFSRFKAPDFEGFTFALSSAVQLMNAAGATWVGQLCVELGKQYGKS